MTSKITTITLHLPGYDESVITVEAIPYGRFAIHEHEDKCWTVDHIKYGYNVFQNEVFTKRNAIKLAKALEEALPEEDIEWIHHNVKRKRDENSPDVLARCKEIWSKIHATNWRLLTIW